MCHSHMVENANHNSWNKNRDARGDLEMIRVPLRSHMQETGSHMSRDMTILQTMPQRREQRQFTKEGLIVKRKYPVMYNPDVAENLHISFVVTS